MKFSTDINGPHKMAPTDFSDPLTFPAMPLVLIVSTAI